MRWEDERYVRVYTRDTIDWQFLSFEAQGLLTLLLRKVDRAGILEFGRHGVEGVAAAIGHPGRWETIKSALAELVADRCVVVEATRLLLPNFIEAQEAKTSDKERQRKSRESARVRHTVSQPVTSGHTASQPVTLSLAVPAVLSRAEPAKPAVPEKPTAVVQSPPGPSLRDHLEADFKAQKGVAYAWVTTNLADDKAVGLLVDRGDWSEIRRRWAIALRARYPACGGVADLAKHWNAYAAEQATGPPKPKRPGERIGAEEVDWSNVQPEISDGF